MIQQENKTKECKGELIPKRDLFKVVGPCARSARIATTILLANPAVKQQCLHCCVSAWRMLWLIGICVLTAAVDGGGGATGTAAESSQKPTTGKQRCLHCQSWSSSSFDGNIKSWLQFWDNLEDRRRRPH
ncbi:hypothetical protein MSG28_009977 [Choristoneura fumiferana]|uniref:Uncharacterized protein n=1 Tax=Choristoneura fumiferana TaxID=7141 RepID=A0ACC0JDA9_CHOFU|nr:hypothetical protein MSG28_009977 [Choristoneura fumiferana]